MRVVGENDGNDGEMERCTMMAKSKEQRREKESLTPSDRKPLNSEWELVLH